MSDTLQLHRGASGVPGPVSHVEDPVMTDQQTILGDGTAAHPLRVNPSGLPVATDGHTVLGKGTLSDPLRAVIPKPAIVPPVLPVTIHGAAFQPSNPGQIAAPGVSLGLTGIFIPGRSGTVLLLADVELPVGTRVTSVTLHVTDGLGTQIEAHFGAQDGSLVKVSSLSPGDGGEHVLTIEVDASIEAGKAYFLDVINPNGNEGWSLSHATIA